MTTSNLPHLTPDVWGPEHDEPIDLYLTIDGEVALAMVEQSETYAALRRETFDRVTAELVAAGFNLTAVSA